MSDQKPSRIEKHANHFILFAGFLILVIGSMFVSQDTSLISLAVEGQGNLNERLIASTPFDDPDIVKVIKDIPLIGQLLSDSLRFIVNIPILREALLIIPISYWIFNAFYAGLLCGRSIRKKGFGCLGNIILGIIGLSVGTMILQMLGIVQIAGIPIIGGIITGFMGAIVFVHVIRLVDSNFAKFV